MRSYTVKEDHIGSAVSKILRYRQTEKQTYRHPDILLLYHLYTAVKVEAKDLDIFAHYIYNIRKANKHKPGC